MVKNHESAGIMLGDYFHEQSSSSTVMGIKKELSRAREKWKREGIFLSRFKVESEKWILMKTMMRFQEEITAKVI